MQNIFVPRLSHIYLVCNRSVTEPILIADGEPEMKTYVMPHHADIMMHSRIIKYNIVFRSFTYILNVLALVAVGMLSRARMNIKVYQLATLVQHY